MGLFSLLRNSRALYSILAFILTIGAGLPGLNIPNADMSDVTLPDGFEEQLNADSFENTADVRIMDSNVMVDYDWGYGVTAPVPPRAAMFYKILEAYRPDVVGVQEASKAWSANFIRNLPGGYRLINPVSTYTDEKMTALIYNTDTLKLIDSGDFKFNQDVDKRLRRVVWGVFEVKETGKIFGVTNTHFDGINWEDTSSLQKTFAEADEMVAAVNKIIKKYDCPVFSTGDYNTRDNNYEQTMWSETYARITESLLDTKHNCKNAREGNAKDHPDEIKYNVYITLDMPFIDHIFYKGNAEIETYCLLSYTYLDDLSDAFPIFTDAILN